MEDVLEVLEVQVERRGLSRKRIDQFDRWVMTTSSDEYRCPICLRAAAEGEVFVVLDCQHKFHESCTARLFEGSTRCGVCRRSFAQQQQQRRQVRHLQIL